MNKKHTQILFTALFAFYVSFISVPYVSADVIPEESDANDEMLADETMASDEMGGRVIGEVVGVDPASGTLMIRDTRQGNEIVTLTVDDGTTYFGTDSLKTINTGDYISVDCIAVKGNYTADNIVMQKKAAEETPPYVLEKPLVD